MVLVALAALAASIDVSALVEVVPEEPFADSPHAAQNVTTAITARNSLVMPRIYLPPCDYLRTSRAQGLSVLVLRATTYQLDELLGGSVRHCLRR